MDDQHRTKEIVSEQKNTSQYIRTYAKDLAKFSGKEAASATDALAQMPHPKVSAPVPERVHEAKPVSVQKFPPESKPKREHHGFSFLNFLFVHNEPHINAMEETLPEEKSHDTSILTNQTDKSHPAEGPTVKEGEPDNPLLLPSLPPPEPLPATPIIATPTLPPASVYPTPIQISAPAPRPDVSFEYQPLPVALPATPTRSKWAARLAQNTEPAPFTSAPEPTSIPPVVEMPLKVGTPPNFGTIPVVTPFVQTTSTPLHTFSSDFSDRIDSERASRFSVLAAETDAHSAKAERPKSSGGLVPVLIGVVLIIAGAVGIYAAYSVFHGRTAVTLSLTPPSLITPDQSVELSGTGQNLLEALASQSQTPLPENTVLLTYISEATTTNAGSVEVPGSGNSFLEALGLPAPDILLRNIGSESTVGVVHAGTETAPFFIIRVTSYTRTFAGMLDWEPTMASDLAELYPPYPVTATVISSSTPGSNVAVPVTQPNQFIDEVVDNHNTRVLQDSEGRSIIIYGYADPQTLIIARDEDAFTLILSRLQTAGE